VGDEVSQFNGENVPRHAATWLRNRKPGDELRLRILRNEQPVEIKFALGGKSATIFAISEDPQATAKARAIREGLLHGKPIAAVAASATTR